MSVSGDKEELPGPTKRVLIYMATIKVKLRPSSISGKAGTIYYQVTHRRIPQQITTNIRLLPEHWDKDRECVLPSESEAGLLQSRINGELSVLRTIIRDFDKTGLPYTTKEIVRAFRSSGKNVSAFVFMREQIEALRQCHRLGTARNYERALSCFAQLSVRIFLSSR